MAGAPFTQRERIIMFKWILDLFFKPKGFLCDTCAYDYDRACYNPKRPNVKECKEYKKRY